MPTIRLEFDLDSEVYPELHAALAGLTSVRARGERMRQLATAGLVWENVRIHGAAAIGPSPRGEAVVPLAEGGGARLGATASTLAATPAAVAPPARPERRSPSRAKVPPAAPASDPLDPDFIDLAINAVPTPPAERRRPRAAPRLAEYVERELPVLRDIVPEGSVSVDPTGPREEAPPALADAVHARPPEEPAHPPVDAVAGHEHPVELPEGVTHLPSLALKPASRSRLMRMKEKGLFKNG